MALIYRPDATQMYPNNETIDPSANNDFQVVIDGKVCIAYRLYIYDLDNNLVAGASTSRTELASSLYDDDILEITVSSGSLDAGQDYKWKVWLYANDKTVSSIDTGTDIITSTTHGFETGDLCTVRSDDTIPAGLSADNLYYVRKISSSTLALYSTYEAAISDGTKVDITSSGAGNIYLSQTSESNAVLFQAYSDPTLSLTIITPWNDQEITPYPTYSQSEDVQVKYFEAGLYDSNQNLITESGEIYSSNVGYTFDGLLNGETYYVKFDVITDLEQEVSTGFVSFDVSYSEPSVIASPEVTNIPNKSAILIDWDSAVKNPTITSSGIMTYIDDFIYVGNKGLELNSAEYVEWSDEVYVPEDYTFHLVWNPQDAGFTGEIFRLTNDSTSDYLLVGYDGTQFYTYDGTTTTNYSTTHTIATNKYYLLVLIDDVLTVIETTI